jgi:uncharacterized protein (DUF433 family)
MIDLPEFLRIDADGNIRVAGTRVPLELIVLAFQEGASAEEIAQRYPTLTLADVYGTIAFYLRRQKDVDEYVAEQRRKAVATRAEIEKRFPPEGIRARLLARRQQISP